MKTTVHQSIHELSIGDIMGEEMDVWMTKSNGLGFDLEINNEDGEVIIEETIHPCAAEAFARFCRNFVHFYEESLRRQALRVAS